ncbi:MAG: carboxypeptidase-like regulatory domain-containing protein [Candidatus Acidiferrum sp.]
MNAGKTKFDDQAAGVKIWKALLGRRSVRVCESLQGGGRLLGLGLGVALLCGIPALGQPRQTLLGGETDRSPVAGAIAGLANGVNVSAGRATANLVQLGGQQAAGTISGTVVDPTGGVVVGARVKLSGADPSQNQEVISDEEGKFSLAGIAPGPFQLTVTADGFVAQTFSGAVNSGESYVVPAIALVLASSSSHVLVTMTRTELAEAEIKDEEKQRVFGVLPNFYVTYNPAAVPLSSKQKFELAWKTTVDPISFGLTGAVAGIEQATNTFPGYGQGAQGYAKRYGASYANLVAGTFIGSAMLPSLLKQDPRYFYKGKGTVRSRVLYALANSVICKGDNGKWQPNYSGILGGLAAGGISNLYYPAADRNDLALTFENTLIGIGTTAAANLLQEFVVRKFTPHAPNYTPAQP